MAALVQYSDSSNSGSEGDGGDTTDATSPPDRGHLKRTLAVHENPINSPSVEDGKRRKCLELPSAVLAMFGDTELVRDDPSLHQGRSRSFGHVRGNWATYVYVPVAFNAQMQLLITSLLEVVKTCGDWQQMELLHISVSRTVILRHHWIDLLMTDIRQSLATIPNFHCDLASVQLYTNDERTRTFIGLRAHSGDTELRHIVRVVDDCLAEFRLPTYYKDPSFHVSIAWTLGDVTAQVTHAMKNKLQQTLADTINYHPQLGMMDVNDLKAKTGNKVFTFPLNTAR